MILPLNIASDVAKLKERKVVLLKELVEIETKLLEVEE